MTLNKAYEILERYYLYLDDTTNMEDYDVDVAYTKSRLEKILQGSFDNSDKMFLSELLTDDIGESVTEAIKYLLQG